MDLEKEESIDLGKLWQVTKAHKKVVGGIIVGCTAIATITAFVLPKQYESTTLVQTRSASKEMGGQAAAMLAAATGTSTASPTNNYMELMKTRTVLDPIIDELYEGKDPDKKPDAAGFAKSNLDIKNTKGTNLITVTAKGKTPEEAQQISQEVVDNFLKMQTDNSQQTQSLLVQFLNGRIEEAKKDSDDAAQKFADFSREHKLYSPDEQLKQAITQVSAYDKVHRRPPEPAESCPGPVRRRDQQARPAEVQLQSLRHQRQRHRSEHPRPDCRQGSRARRPAPEIHRQ